MKTNWLKEKRENLSITQKELAEKTGISISSIKRFEDSADIADEYLKKIANALECNIEEISEKKCIENAIKSAKRIKESAKNDRLITNYKIKMTQNLTAKEYNKIIENILLLSSTFNIYTPFLFPIITDIKHEISNSVIYSFINAL